MVEICVVNCCFCQTFQGQQVKKEKKWTCKMCGEKQSFRKIFAQGTGKECRLYIQKMNMMKGNMHKQKENDYEPKREEIDELIEPINQQNTASEMACESKWKLFVPEQPDPNQDGGENNEGNFSTTDRAIFNEYKGQKRKKDMSSEQELTNYPRKTKKTNSTKRTPTGHDLVNKQETIPKNSKNFSMIKPIGTGIPENHVPKFENKLCNYNHAKATSSKWSKFA